MDLRDLVASAIDVARASVDAEGLPSATYRFGDLSVRIYAHRRGRIAPMLATIAARAELDLSPASTIFLIDRPTAALELLLPPVEKRGRRMLRANDEIYYLWLEEAGGYLTAVDRRRGQAIVWYTDPDRIASWHIARPLLHAIKGLCFATPWTPVHAAAVALDGHALLFVGESGAGKTSLAISCTLAGWDYFGDDAVIVRSQPARVGALYASARLREDTFERFRDAMGASLGISDDAGELKAELDMGRLRPLTADEAAISALIVPRRTDSQRMRLTRIGRGDALRAMMNAAQQSLVGDDTSAFEKFGGIAAEVDCYALDPGGDAAETNTALARLVGR